MRKMKAENGKIAKNTIFLYIRQLVVLFISLYTSRVVLSELGVTDYGLYNVVGGIIVIFGFITNAISNSTSRYLSYALGTGNYREIEKTFGAFLAIYYFLGLIVLVLGETIGLWFVYNYLSIPADRFNAAIWVYQFSIFTAIMNLLYIPHNGLIVARERMSAFAFISILDAGMKLIIVYLISISPFDKLIFYAFLIFLISCIHRLIYGFYCKRNFSETSARLFYDKKMCIEIMKYSGWVLFSSLSFATYTQGLNVLLNVYFGPAVNAARAVAVQVQGASQNFVTGFQTAIYPQIIKSYAQNDLHRMHTLLHVACKGSYFLFYVLAMPFLMKADFILELWLKDVPAYAVPFTCLILIFSMLRAITNEINHAVQATGIIRNFQVADGIMGLLILPLSYISLEYLHTSPMSVFVILVLMEFVTVFVRIYLGIPHIGDSIRLFIKDVLIPVLYVTIIGSLIPIIISFKTESNLLGFIMILASIMFWTVPSVFFIGLTKIERDFVMCRLKRLLQKKKACSYISNANNSNF